MSYLNRLFVISFFLTQFYPTTHAEITFDGSLGHAIELSEPYNITADQGTLQGNNLFHSFGIFNIESGKTATFSAPSDITNIIGRITGGNISRIDGTLESISNANLYLLNPHGFVIGRDARIDVNGSFYLSSADYLRFADGQQFDMNTSKPPLLEIANPVAFGFLGDKAGNITFNDFTNYGYTTVNEGKELSVIGGNYIQINNSRLSAPKGHIQIVSAASSGEIERTDVTKNTIKQFGEVLIKDSSLHTNAELGKSGTIVIQSRQFYMNNSKIQTISDAGSGDIKIVSIEKLQVIGNSVLEMKNKQECGGKIVLYSQNIELFNNESSDNKLSDLWGIISESTGEGQGGSIEIKDSNTIHINKFPILATTSGDGNAGNIDIETNNLKLTNSAQINASSEGDGKGGTITINAEKININGYLEENDSINPSGIASSAFGSGSGNNIRISAQSLNLDNWATIQTLTQGEGNAGNISINVNELQITNGADIDASNEGTGTGKAGNINITANNSVFITAQEAIDSENIFVVKKGYLGGIYSSANKKGTGGNITLTTKYLAMSDGGVISVGSEGEGDAGNINLKIDGILNMNNAAILTRSTQAGGNIDIKNPNFMILNNSQLHANANRGNGGNIRIIAEQFIKSFDSELNASSKLAKDGEITIEAPDTDLTSSQVILPKTFFDASDFYLKSCTGRDFHKNLKLLKRKWPEEALEEIANFSQF